MKIFLIAILSLTLWGSTLSVKVTNILNADGKISIGVCSDPNEFAKPNGKVVTGVFEQSQKDELIVKFEGLEDGVYAVSIYHDENNNKILDTNFLGLPSEGYGFSNNLRPMFRGASFEESKFELKGDSEITIQMGY